VNGKAFADPRVEVLFADAFVSAPALNETFDVIIADFPDPDQEIIAKLYAEGFLPPSFVPTGRYRCLSDSGF
jgi:spermidine synthase